MPDMLGISKSMSTRPPTGRSRTGRMVRHHPDVRGSALVRPTRRSDDAAQRRGTARTSVLGTESGTSTCRIRVSMRSSSYPITCTPAQRASKPTQHDQPILAAPHPARVYQTVGSVLARGGMPPACQSKAWHGHALVVPSSSQRTAMPWCTFAGICLVITYGSALCAADDRQACPVAWVDAPGLFNLPRPSASDSARYPASR